VKRLCVLIAALLTALPLLAQGSSAGASTNKSTSAAVDAGDYVYVSAQGPRDANGSTPHTFADQVRQSLENVSSLVKAAGLSNEHIVYVQVYLRDTSSSKELDQVFASYFPHDPPARAVLGVAQLPQPPVEITAVAVRDLHDKRAVSPANAPVNNAYSPGLLTHDRLFVSTMLGRDPTTGSVPADPAAQVNLALDGVKAVLEAAGLTMANMVFVNPYLTTDIPARTMNEQYARRFEFGNTPARATIEVSGLPDGAHIAYTGVAVRDLSRRKSIRPKNMPPSPTASPCVFAGDTLYCSAKSGFIPGPNGGIFTPSIPDQTRQTMRNLLDNLEEAEMSYAQVVSTTIWLDDLQDLPLFTRVYERYFGDKLPSDSIIQQLPPVERKVDEREHYPDLEQVSLIAVRGQNVHTINPMK